MDRIKKGMYQTLASLIGICIVIAAGIVLFRNQLLGLFLDKTQAAEAIAIGSKYLTIVCVAYIVAAVMRTYLNVLRGAGDVNTSAVAGILELIGRIIFAYILVRPLGSTVFGLLLRSPGQWVRQYPLSDTIRVSGLIKSWYSTKPVGKMSTGFCFYSSTNFTDFFSEIGCNCDDNTNIFTLFALSFLSREIFVSSFIESGTLSIPIITPFSSYIAAYT